MHGGDGERPACWIGTLENTVLPSLPSPPLPQFFPSLPRSTQKERCPEVKRASGRGGGCPAPAAAGGAG